jgi:hypothetical protein
LWHALSAFTKPVNGVTVEMPGIADSRPFQDSIAVQVLPGLAIKEGKLWPIAFSVSLISA